MSSHFSFPPQVRVHTAAEYKAIYDKKCNASDGLLLVFADRNGLEHCRLGTSVSKKRGNSVVRHHEKRLIREAFRHCQTELPAGLDLVVIPIGGELSVSECQGRLIALAKRLAKRLPAKANNPSQELTL
jgi:ribonuclease P protein component